MLHPSLPSQTGFRSTIAGLVVACILCGCSSRIYTSLSEAGAPLPADSVRLFTEDLPRPASSRKIGELTISSSSENADERNREAVDLAVRATAGIGGDALSVTEQNETVTSNGTTYTYSQKLTVKATAYSCEGYTGYTYSGTVARVGAIAVDPNYIPLGTKMYIVSNDGQYVYGYCVAEDTGSAIKGYKVDLYFNTIAECYAFGVRTCTLYILN